MKLADHIGYRSAGSWVAFAFLLLAGSRGLRVFHALDLRSELASDVSAGSPVERNIMLCMILVSCVLMAYRSINWSHFAWRNTALIMVFAWMALSVLWSDVPFISIRRLIKALGLFTIAALVLTDDDPYRAMVTALRRYCWVVLPLSIVFIYAIPSLGITTAYDGSPMHVGACLSKNNLGQASAVGVLLAFAGLLDRESWSDRNWNLALLVVATASLLVGNSASSLLAVILCIGAVIAVSITAATAPTHAASVLFLIAIGAGSGVLLVEQLVLQRELLVTVIHQLGRDATLTGRTDLWYDMVLLIKQAPWLGHGYGSVWLEGEGAAQVIWDHYIWHPNQAHCGYLDVMAALGIIGLCLLVIAIVVAVWQMFEQLRHQPAYGRFRVMMLALCLVNNVTESSLCRSIHLLWFVAVLVIGDSLDVRRSLPEVVSGTEAT